MQPDQGRILLAIARHAIAPQQGTDSAALPAADWLEAPGACFVTLTRDGALRGCIGSLYPRRALRQDVEMNARAAAFSDPRFSPLSPTEAAAVDVEVSLLSALQPLDSASQAQALARLRPGVDGLLLECNARHATFLPQVWEQLPDPDEFLAQLKRKAGLPADFWDNDLRLSRYTVQKWRESEMTRR